jgi:hypothetical protein
LAEGYGLLSVEASELATQDSGSFLSDRALSLIGSGRIQKSDSEGAKVVVKKR